MNKRFIAHTLALIAACHYQRSAVEIGTTWQGHEYPINNKKGFAAKDKRRSKKRRGGR